MKKLKTTIKIIKFRIIFLARLKKDREGFFFKLNLWKGLHNLTACVNQGMERAL